MQSGQTSPVGADVARGLGTRRRVLREADLEWFFCFGQSLFEASTFGHVLERQSVYAARFLECELCKGSGFDAADNTCKACGGMGGVPERHVADHEQNPMRLSSLPCPQCHASGRYRVNKRVRVDLAAMAWCTRCQGSGSLQCRPVAVKSEKREESSYTPDDNALIRFAKVSRWLTRTRPWAVEVLEAYYGLRGYRWGATKWGRLFAVLPLTDGGKEMLRLVDNPMGLPSHELLGNVCAQLDQEKDGGRRMMFKRHLAEATASASSLLGRATTTWNVVVERGRA